MISAKQNQGVEEVKNSIRETLDKYAEEQLNESLNEKESSDRKKAQKAT